MKWILRILVFLFAGQIVGAQAAGYGTAEEAVAMVKRAGALMKAKGKDEAFKQFNEPAGSFVDRDLYIAVIDAKGTMLSHGANPKLIGKALMELKDADGKPFIKALVDLAQGSGSGWVDYKWPNPVTKLIDSKSTYVEKLGDLTIACGVYKK
ncbi:cache domain-containing protein [Pseudoduganella sp. LjRoot289]